MPRLSVRVPVRVGACAAITAIAVLGASGVVCPRVARAQTSPPTESAKARAAHEFEDGARAFEAGDFRGAAERFEAAYRIAPHPSPLFNAARAWYRAGDAARAATSYARFLRTAPADARDRPTAAATLDELAPKLGRLDLPAASVAAGGVTAGTATATATEVSVDGVVASDPNVYVTPGTHVVARGAVRKSVAVDAGASVGVAFDDAGPAVGGAGGPGVLAPAPGSGSAGSAAVPAPGRASASPPAPPPDGASGHAAGRSGWSPLVVWVGTAVTGGALTLTIWSGLDTNRFKRDVYDETPTRANYDAGLTRERRTNALVAVTVLAGVATGVAAIWLVDWGSARAGATADGRLVVGGSFR